MASPKGESEFCYTETLSVSEGIIEGEGETKLTVSQGRPVIKCLVIPPNSKIKKKF